MLSQFVSLIVLYLKFNKASATRTLNLFGLLQRIRVNHVIVPPTSPFIVPFKMDSIPPYDGLFIYLTLKRPKMSLTEAVILTVHVNKPKIKLTLEIKLLK